MILRPATVADRDAVVTLALHFHADSAYTQLLTVDPERVGALFDVALQQGIVFVAEFQHGDEHELVGFLAAVGMTHMLSGDRYAEECGWWVEPPFRAGTLGPRLHRRFLEWATEDGYAFVVMGAPAGAVDVARFYGQQGYLPVETRHMKRLSAVTPGLQGVA